MKNLWSKKRLLWVFWGVLGMGLVAAGYIQEVDASNTAKKGKKWPVTTEYFLLRDLTVDTANDRILTIAGLRSDIMNLNSGYLWIPSASANKPRCGSVCVDGTCDDFGVADDTTFPAVNQTYYSAFTLILNKRNIFASRIPKALYVKGNKSPLPGKLFASMVLMTDAYNDGKCYEIGNNGTETWTFRKYRSLFE